MARDHDKPTSSASPMSTAAALSTDDETIVAAFDTVLEAEMARGRLEVEGIVSRIVDGNTVGIAAHLSLALGGAKVVVSHSDLEAARTVLFAPSAFNDDELAAASVAAAEPVDEEEAPLAPLPVDDDAGRALKAAVFGLIFLPPIGHAWSAYMLARVWPRRAELTPRGRRQAWAAVVIDGVVFGITAAIAVAIL